jgi:hypothetical protein
MPLAEYNLEELCQYLKSEDIIQRGDTIIMRIFGESPHVPNLGYHLKKIPKGQVTFEVNRTGIFIQHTQVKVTNYQSGKYDPAQTVQEIKDWYHNNMPRSPYQTSPLLNHIHRVITCYPVIHYKKKVFIFVTDGLIEFGNDIKFDPEMSSPQLDKMVRIVETRADNLQPFRRSSLDNNSLNKIIIMGLYSPSCNTHFEPQIEQLLRWFCEPLGKDFVNIFHD